MGLWARTSSTSSRKTAQPAYCIPAMKFPSLVVAAVVATAMFPVIVQAFSPSSAGMIHDPKRTIHEREGGKVSLFLTTTEPEMESPSEEYKSLLESNKEFVNNSPMAWMQDFFELAGIVPGQTIAYGPFTTGKVPESLRIQAPEATKRRDEAAKNLQNIDMAERARRANASNVMTVVTVVYVVWATLVGDQGDLGGHILRFLTVLPLFLAVGYRLSAQTGL